MAKSRRRSCVASTTIVFSVFEASRGLASFDEMPPPTAAGGSPWGLTSGDAGLASVDAERARRTMTMYDVSIWISARRRRGVRWGIGIVVFTGRNNCDRGLAQIFFDR